MLILNQKCHMAVREGLSCLAFAQHAPHRGFAIGLRYRAGWSNPPIGFASPPRGVMLLSD